MLQILQNNASNKDQEQKELLVKDNSDEEELGLMIP
jgi:hypothetical protein